MFTEMGARRRRLRAMFGDRGQGVAEFLVLGGLLVGSLGLFVREWMPAAAPWGFALPFVFIAGYLLIEARRQAAVAAYKRRLSSLNDDLDRDEFQRLLARHKFSSELDREAIAEAQVKFDAEAPQRWQARLDNADAVVASSGYDWFVLLWSFGCALVGVAAFVIAWTAQPVEPVDPNDWTPPESSVAVDISP